MNNIKLFYCKKTMKMNDDSVAFKKGKFYHGTVDGDGYAQLKSEISDDDKMDHAMDEDYIKKYLKIFKLGR